MEKIIKLEEDYSWYLNRIIENEEFIEYCSKMDQIISEELKQINFKMNSPIEYYKGLKKRIIKDNLCFSLFLLTCAGFFDLLVDNKVLERIIYTIAIIKPMLMTPTMYKEYKSKFDKKILSERELLLNEKRNLEHALELNEEILKKLGTYSCLTDKEWNEYEVLEHRFVFSKNSKTEIDN